MTYFKWHEQIISDFSDESINTAYNSGYVFTRVKKGLMNQTRSLRIDLSKFALSSENRRILRKTEGLELSISPLPYEQYHWSIGKMAKDFYTEKFGDGTFSANKMKELLTSSDSNFNRLFVYNDDEITSSTLRLRPEGKQRNSEIGENARNNTRLPADMEGPKGSAFDNVTGYCIAVETSELIHYCYPFYDLTSTVSNLGMGMMLRAILYAKECGKQYIYLGSFQRPTDVYKLQFTGLEWFGGKNWQDDLNNLKKLI